MNLKEFITSTLIEIAEGVNDAMPVYKKLNAAVNPSNLCKDGFLYFQGSNRPGHTEDYRFSLSNIEFEIGLTDNNGKEGQSGIGVFFGSVGLGTKTTEQENTKSITKVKFSIPVKLPTQKL